MLSFFVGCRSCWTTVIWDVMILILCHCTRLCYNQESKYSDIFPYMYDTFYLLLRVHQYITGGHSNGTFSIYKRLLKQYHFTAFLWSSVSYSRSKAFTSLDRLKFSSPDSWMARPRCYTGYCLISTPLDKKAVIWADDIFNCIFLNENDAIPIQIPVKYVPGSPIDNKPALGNGLAPNRRLDQWWPSSLTRICVTRGRCLDQSRHSVHVLLLETQRSRFNQ